MKKIIFSMFFVLEILVGQSWAIDISNYFPLNSGDVKAYLENGSEYIVETVLPGTYHLNGSATKIVSKSGSTVQSYWSNDSYGIREHRSIDSTYVNGQYATVTTVLNPPVIFAYPTANVGDQINNSGTTDINISEFGTYQLNYSYSNTFLGYEIISVPYGTFNTIKISNDLSLWGYIEGQWVSSVVSSYFWLADYIGIVKYNFTGDGTTVTGVLVDSNVTLPPDYWNPVADTKGPYFGMVTVPITFNGADSIATPGSTIVNYSWDFGDGISDYGATPEHRYDEAGVYAVTLRVTDQGGLVDSDNTTVTIPNSNIPGSALYRFWSNQNGTHFYTISEGERDNIIASFPEDVWKYETVAYYGYALGDQPVSAKPVYRFWSDQNQAHFYTISEEEKDYITINYPEQVWRYEAIAYYAFAPGEEPTDAKPVYRFWSDTSYTHFYTISEEERDYIIANYPDEVWRYETIAWYAYANQ